MKSDSIKDKIKNPNVSVSNLLNFIDNIDHETLRNPNDDEREPSGDGNEMDSNIHDNPIPFNEETTLATQLDDNNDISEGSQSNSNGSSNKKYGIEKHVKYSKPSAMNLCFASNLNKSSEPKSYHKVALDKYWVEAMNNEMEAFKKQETLFRSSAEAECRCMLSTTCEILWLISLLKDLNVDGLLPMPLYWDSTSAIQITANPVFHEKTKHFDIDVHLVREKVATIAISTIKINSAKNVIDIFTKSLSITQHKQFCL
ncbi:ribonuclease H-like domain-containing protein [Tanacetum coccineum]